MNVDITASINLYDIFTLKYIYVPPPLLSPYQLSYIYGNTLSTVHYTKDLSLISI